MDVLPLDVILGGCEQAAAAINELTDQVVALDHLDRDRVLRLVCERVTDSDPVLLAGPGQIWTLRDDVDADDAPAPFLEITARVDAIDAELPTVLVRCIGGEDSGVFSEMPLAGLYVYQLSAWDYRPRRISRDPLTRRLRRFASQLITSFARRLGGPTRAL